MAIKRYKLEAALRPVVEFQSAFLALMMASFVWLFQYYLFMPPVISGVAAIGFGLYAAWRLKDALRLRYYQKHLSVLPRYLLKRSRIPVSGQALFIGKGFPWRQRHTQRLRDSMLPNNDRFLEDSRGYRFARNLERRFENTVLFYWLFRMLSSQSRFNPFRRKPEVGGNPALHAVGLLEAERNIYLPISERVGHTLVLGTTRVGKTRLAEILITQDIKRGKKTERKDTREAVIVLDPKGDADLLECCYAAAAEAGRLDDLLLFHLSHPDVSARYNPIGNYSRITEVASRIANALPSEGNSSAFKEFGWRFTNIIARALHVLGEKPTYENLLSHVSNIDRLFSRYAGHFFELHGVADWRKKVDYVAWALSQGNDRPADVPPRQKEEQGKDGRIVACARLIRLTMAEEAIDDPVAEGLLTAFYYDKTYFDKIVSSLGPFLEKLTSGKVSELFSPDYSDPQDSRPLFDWQQVIKQRKIVYVGLSALQDATVASAVGAAMFSDLTSVAGDLYAHDPFMPGDSPHGKVSIHADEFNELIGPDFIPLLNKAGGAGFQVTAYTQTMSDIESRLGNRSKAEVVLGNLNNLIMLRVLKEDTAKVLTDRLNDVQVEQIMTESGATSSSDPDSEQHFTSNVRDRVSTIDAKIVQPSDINHLPKGQCFALVEGSQLYKIRMPLPKKDSKVVIPDSIAALTAHMRMEYVNGPDDWYTDEWFNHQVETRYDGNLTDDMEAMIANSAASAASEPSAAASEPSASAAASAAASEPSPSSLASLAAAGGMVADGTSDGGDDESIAV